ncbi:MAG: hypothetical protein GXP27_01995 [Planctomycetes bacterium]|nr:hypothetical protein [Planctomycetota bacterium]
MRALRKGFVVVIAGLGLALGRPANSQLRPAPPSPEARMERLYQFLDRNQDDLIDEGELERMPPAIRNAMERAGLRTNRRISKQLFFRMAPRLAEELRRPAETPPFAGETNRSETPSPARPAVVGSPGSPSSVPNASRPSPVSQPSSTVATGPATPQRSSLPSRTPSSSASSARPRITIDLPESYRDRDKDHDGQIGLYEWDRKAYAEFFRLDRNGDGFLTPRELLAASSSSGAVSGTAGSGAPPIVTTPRLPSGSSTVRNSAAVSASQAPTVDVSSRDERMARFVFRALDRNRDGTITEEEWQRSRRTREMFQRAGLSLQFPVSPDAFIPAYVQAAQAARSARR